MTGHFTDTGDEAQVNLLASDISRVALIHPILYVARRDAVRPYVLNSKID